MALPNSSFDSALFDDFILPAQRQYLRPFISKEFYNTILTQVEGSTLTTDNSTLLNDYLKQMLSYFIVFDALPQIRTQITSQGLLTGTTETSQVATDKDFSHLRNWFLSLAERWKKDAIEFIEEEQDDDSSKFPDFSRAKDRHQNKYGFILYDTQPPQTVIRVDENLKKKC